MWELLHKIAYCHDYSVQQGNGHTLPLDPINVACQADLSALGAQTKCRFTKHAVDVCVKEEAFMLCVQGASHGTRATTAAKWGPHLESLEKMDVIEKCKLEDITFFGKYFAVPKDENFSRSIFNGKRLSEESTVPPSVNLLHISAILELASKLALDGKLSIIVGDIRHWFHQLFVPRCRKSYFGVECNGVFYRWKALPMGWSWSPYLSQCIAWGIILFEEYNQETLFVYDRESPSPPQFVKLIYKGKYCGFVTLLYDNIAVFTTSGPLADKLVIRIRKNFERFNVTLKHLDLYNPKQLCVRDGTYDGPCHLGVQYALYTKSRKSQLIWRHIESKTKKWEFMCGLVQTPSAVAHTVGVILWDAVVRCEPLCKYSDIIAILRRVSRSTLPTRLDWSTRNVTLEARELTQLNEAMMIPKNNTWIHKQFLLDGDCLYIASDAATSTGWGFVVFTRASEVLHVTSQKWPSLTFSGNIFIQEVAAAVWAVKYVCQHYPTHKQLHILIDNVGAVHSMRKWYSSNDIACDLLRQGFDTCSHWQICLNVIAIQGCDNVADEPSRLLPIDNGKLRRTLQVVEDFHMGSGMVQPQSCIHTRWSREHHELIEDIVDM